jgi:ABC-type multidrug transport system fused ATPase/permease subunit
MLGPGGVGLSGGQRQRIGIARVLLRDPPVLVLDEPTTGLDAASEALVMAGLNRLVEGRTTILITHSIELARSADRVAVLVSGKVAEYDAPELLLGRDSIFRMFTSAQHRPVPQGVDPPRLLHALVPDDAKAERT